MRQGLDDGVAVIQHHLKGCIQREQSWDEPPGPAPWHPPKGPCLLLTSTDPQQHHRVDAPVGPRSHPWGQSILSPSAPIRAWG